jgi:hypothetical protein
MSGLISPNVPIFERTTRNENILVDQADKKRSWVLRVLDCEIWGDHKSKPAFFSRQTKYEVNLPGTDSGQDP